MRLLYTFFYLLTFLYSPGFSQTKENVKTYTFKTIDTVQLNLQVYYPKKLKRKSRVPVVIFFFGGGWTQSAPNQFKSHCIYLTNHRIIGITAEYRVKNIHNTTPQDAISDAKSAIRWIKANSDELLIDKNKIIAAGGSAGGHLAACTATLDGFNDPNDDISIDPIPSAMILFNPALEIPSGVMDRFGGEEEARKASPTFFISEKTPPTLIFHGTDDQLVPASSILEFQKKMIDLGNTCEVILFGDEQHAFFNVGRKGNRPYHQTLVLMKQFLIEEGYLADK
jgi:acetyl esterase/lipase